MLGRICAATKHFTKTLHENLFSVKNDIANSHQ